MNVFTCVTMLVKLESSIQTGMCKTFVFFMSNHSKLDARSCSSTTYILTQVLNRGFCYVFISIYERNSWIIPNMLWQNIADHSSHGSNLFSSCNSLLYNTYYLAYLQLKLLNDISYCLNSFLGYFMWTFHLQDNLCIIKNRMLRVKNV